MKESELNHSSMPNCSLPKERKVDSTHEKQFSKSCKITLMDRTDRKHLTKSNTLVIYKKEREQIRNKKTLNLIKERRQSFPPR